MKQRVEKVQNKLKQADIEAILITNAENRRYLSGFTGTAGMVLITGQQAFLITDFRYISQAKEQAEHMQVVRHGHDRWADVAKLLNEQQVSSLAFEEEEVSFQLYRELKDKLPGKLTPVRQWVEQQRLFKHPAELNSLQKAIDIADAGFSHITNYIAAGKTESEIGLELEFFLRRQGATGAAFDFIVASGPRGALPHGIATSKQVDAGDMITIDFGAVFNGYHSDITRNVVLGKASSRQQEIYQIVLEAQLAAIEAIRPGVACNEVDDVARRLIGNRGYAEYFGHGLGHGVGLAVHEGPRLAPGVDTVLKPGMTITVEPGIYLPDWGGVRIEDIVLVTETGCQILTGSAKDLVMI